jgi:hypothetical protein
MVVYETYHLLSIKLTSRRGHGYNAVKDHPNQPARTAESMTDKQVPVPLKRFADAYGFSIEPKNAFTRWLRNNHWNRAYKIEKQCDLSPAAIRFIDLFNAFYAYTSNSVKTRAIVYSRVARLAHYMDDASIDLWFKEMKREFDSLTGESEEGFKAQWKKCYSLPEFVHLGNLNTMLEEYWVAYELAPRLNNTIKLIGPKDKHSGVPLIYSRRHADLLHPHFDLDAPMNDKLVLEAEGILRLHYAWRTTDDNEKQKIKRFVAAYAEEMNAVIALVESRYVDSLEQLDSLMQQTGSTASLAEGAL